MLWFAILSLLRVLIKYFSCRSVVQNHPDVVERNIVMNCPHGRFVCEIWGVKLSADDAVHEWLVQLLIYINNYIRCTPVMKISAAFSM